ncbi:PAS domain S-box protein [Methanolacinia paynteri]|uniref:PAS domain S-box protein n=1 Tax=Methanolacinia paynteri TaxID=230356 RepID=UPI00064F1693|nr:PAS domain S-box protein [Methanolacinia paynteri]
MISALYVDDEELLLVVAKEYLEKGGEFRIDTAKSVNEALLMIEGNSYDAIISDYQMPGKDGIEFLSEIRDAGNTIPFILFTGKGREDVVIQAINNGADFYIQKGGDPRAQFAELVYKLKIAVDRKFKNDEIVRKNRELRDINSKLELAEKELKDNLEDARRNKAELAESLNRLQQIITFLPDPTFAIDNEGRIIAWNSAMEKLSGAKAEDVMGRGDYEHSYRLLGRRHPILIDLVINPDLEIKYNHSPVSSYGNRIVSEGFFPVFGVEKDVSKWFTSSPLYDINGSLAGAIESIRDITHIKKTSRLLEIQRDLGFSLAGNSTLTGSIKAVLDSLSELDGINACGIYLADTDSGMLKLEASTGISEEFRERVSVMVLKNPGSFFDTGSACTRTGDVFIPEFDEKRIGDEGIKCFHAVRIVYKNEILGFLVCASKKIDEIPPDIKTSIENLAAQASGAIFRSRVNEEKKRMRENLESFFNEINDYLFITDTSGIILMTNSSLRKYTGYGEKDLHGQHISMIHPPEFRDETGIILNGITEGNLGSHFIPVMTKEGEIIPAETRVTSGTIGGNRVILGVSRNISALKEAHDRTLESERRMRAVFDQSFQLAGILDRKGRLLNVNRTAMKYVEGEPEDFIGRYIWETDWWTERPDLQDKIKDAVSMASGGVTVKSETEIIDRDGFMKLLDFSIRPVRDENGEIIYLVPEAADITRRKKAEDALIQANHKLLLLNSITRHDILNRVTPVLGFLEIVKDNASDPDQSDILEKLKSQVKDIENLIKFTGLYDELGASEPSWQNPARILNSLNVPKEIAVKNSLPEIEVYADTMLEKVFSNLLGNSQMHGKRVSEISVSCRRTDKGTSILWKDNGCGIPECNKEKIFLRGFGDNSGLGLFLSKEILSITNIRIRECGKEGEGAVFEIIIPPDGCRSVNNPEEENIEYL